MFMKLQTKPTLTMLCLLLCSTQLTGCFVSISDDPHYDDAYHSSSEQSSSIEDSYEYDEELIEVFEEEVIEETTTTTTTTYDNVGSAPEAGNIEEGSPHVDSRPIVDQEPIMIFEETFETPELTGIDRVAVNRLGQWAIEWTPGSRCEHLVGTGSIEIQAEVDIGHQFEVEGLQHARLDGRCGQDLNPSRLLTSIADVQHARTLTFYARVAETAPYADLMVEWNEQVVMNEPLLDVWAEYIIDLTQVQISDDAILTVTALHPGVLIDHIRVE
jgi:hypothetical protein